MKVDRVGPDQLGESLRLLLTGTFHRKLELMRSERSPSFISEALLTRQRRQQVGTCCCIGGFSPRSKQHEIILTEPSDGRTRRTTSTPERGKTRTRRRKEILTLTERSQNLRMNDLDGFTFRTLTLYLLGTMTISLLGTWTVSLSEPGLFHFEPWLFPL